MNPAMEKPLQIGPPGAQITLTCPETRRPLVERAGKTIACDDDGRILHQWEKKSGFFDLVVGEHFEDATEEACRCYETESNAFSTEFYWIPLFRSLFAGQPKPIRLLAIGCGIGVEVDLLCDAGFACFGIDNGNRTVDWASRRHRENLVMANGRHLPFADGTFDAVFCGCVFPHVGVVGDTNRGARLLSPGLPVVAVVLNDPIDKPVRGYNLPLPSIVPRTIAERLARISLAQSLDIFLRSVDVSSRYVSHLRLQVDKPEIIVRPDVHHIELLDQVKVEDVAALGEQALEQVLPELKRKTTWASRLGRRVFGVN